ncbi:MAG TPA: metalloregulator ArsR/SmtB family transcription factor [Woeseiaceae bacterium]|nr:metalloregulator ArsR/SmtB family transcription factor [Woeseiaceae bacterium]
MNQTQETMMPDDFRALTELHEMASQACELLKAMANEWRLMVLCQLSEGEKTVSELQGILGLSQSALSQHLAVLRREKIVSARKEAQSVFYSLHGDEATRVMAALHDLYCAPASPTDQEPE